VCNKVFMAQGVGSLLCVWGSVANALGLLDPLAANPPSVGFDPSGARR
jgi:hypothetical protein